MKGQQTMEDSYWQTCTGCGQKIILAQNHYGIWQPLDPDGGGRHECGVTYIQDWEMPGDMPDMSDAIRRLFEEMNPQQKVSVTLHLDAKVMNWFKEQGEEFESSINAILRDYIESHKQKND
jgi:hypothetical protein